MKKIGALIVYFFIFLGIVFCNIACPKAKTGMTNVHLVCHTHDDVGWLKTVDQYYYGARKRITWVGVQYILDSVIESLKKDKERKFIFVESAFFFRWWDQQSDNIKEEVKSLVESGQLEFIGGGWSMNDEAAAHYNAIIDQMTLGLVKLNDTFGSAAFPRIAWQIDPFGHSKEQASLFAQMGMDGLFFGRLDHDDKNNRWAKGRMEMVWKGSKSLGESSWLFTGVLPNGYSPPKGFCFDLLCADDPIMDDPRLADYNKNEMVNKFLKAVEEQSSGYSTSNLIMTMGEDFNYEYAESWYKNLDKLIMYVNELQSNGSKVNLFYSTPSCYLDALHSSGKVWPTKSDDFFPYASDPHAYWTGYFTSRPTLKGFIRYSNNVLQAGKQISALSGEGYTPKLEKLMKAVAVLQHHDAVTGTAKQHVTDDYSQRLSEGVHSAYQIMEKGLKRLHGFTKNHLEDLTPFEYCPLLNISACPFTETSREFTTLVYNPLSRERSAYVRIPITEKYHHSVFDESGKELETQLISVPKRVQSIPGRNSTAKYELVFYAENLPPLSTKKFAVQLKKERRTLIHLWNRKSRNHLFDTSISQGDLSLTLSSTTNKMKSISIKTGNKRTIVNVTQSWLWYAGKRGNNSESEMRASGAYIFRPDGDAKDFGSAKVLGIYNGPLVSECHLEWTPWVSQIVRLYKHKKFVEIEWLVGPIPIDDGVGKEIVNRIKFENFPTNKIFYTDANGREMVKRVLNHRDTWPLKLSEPVSQNYYPVTSRLILQSINGRENASILNDRAQGGTSLSDGEMELMVHRRLLDDDAFGVGEPLNEEAFGEGLVARGSHYLLHSDTAGEDCDFGCEHRLLGEELLLKPVVTFSSIDHFYSKSSNLQMSALRKSLPLNLRILTLEPWMREGKWLLRLENFFEAHESAQSRTVKVNVKELFAQWNVTSIEELTLGANLLKKDLKRLKWNVAEGDMATAQPSIREEETVFDDEFSFEPMKIRTFLIGIKPI